MSNITTTILTNVTTGLPYVAVYKKVPLFLQPIFAILVIVVLALLVLWFYHWFRVSLRNRTNVIIHLPDKTRLHKSYKNFTGEVFKIKSFELDKDGKPLYYNYHFKIECLERGFFGNYIEYDYGILEPLDPNSRSKDYRNGSFNLKELLKFVSSLLNTDLAVDLLLNSKFKEFVKIMLIIILVAVVIDIGINIYPLIVHSKIQVCTLANDNQTIQVIRQALSTPIKR